MNSGEIEVFTGYGALGAHQAEVRRRFVRHGVIVTSVGVAIGVVAAVGVTRLMRTPLFEVSPLDPLRAVAVAVLLVMAAAVASDMPAKMVAKDEVADPKVG